MLKDKLEKQQLFQYSSFGIVEKTLQEVITLCLQSERLKKLLYYTDKHALGLPKLTQEQSFSLLNNQIKIVPKLEVDSDTKPYVIITMDNFDPVPGQTTFRNVTLSFDILCGYDFWSLDDFKLRPYSIAGEIDALINRSTITGFGIAEFALAKQLILNEHLGGLSLYYNLVSYNDDVKRNQSND